MGFEKPTSQEEQKEQFEKRNFNEDIWVKLTKRGKGILGGDVEEDEEGYTRMTFSDFMRELGGKDLYGKVANVEGKDQLPFFMDFKMKKVDEKK